jgi:hypothetical protein
MQTLVGRDVEGATAAPLDLHEGIGTGHVCEGCKRWPEHLRLLNHTTGELVPGRCRATNLCPYCQTLYVVETVEMLTLDAVEYAPTLWLVLTAREHLTRDQLRVHLRHLRRVTRRRWPDIEWFVQVEFQRRGALHANLLVKGVPVAELDELHGVVATEWCARVDAEPVGQWSGAIADGLGVVRYLSKMLAHGLKAEQRPPIGWRGHRTSQTRGYLVRPASVMREEARAALKLKRKLWRGLSLEVAMHELERESSESWSLHSTGLGGPDSDRERSRAARAPFTFAPANAPAAHVTVNASSVPRAQVEPVHASPADPASARQCAAAGAAASQRSP